MATGLYAIHPWMAARCRSGRQLRADELRHRRRDGGTGPRSRDHEFATKYGLEIVRSSPIDGDADVSEAAYTEKGVLFNSGEFDGSTSRAPSMPSPTWKAAGKGKRTVNYRLRDWGVSRHATGAPHPPC